VAGWRRCDDDGIDLVEDVAKVRAAAHRRVAHRIDEPPFVLVDHRHIDVGKAAQHAHVPGAPAADHRDPRRSTPVAGTLRSSWATVEP